MTKESKKEYMSTESIKRIINILEKLESAIKDDIQWGLYNNKEKCK